jgi:hypothetical protein
MKTQHPFCINFGVQLCRIISFVLAGQHFIVLHLGYLDIPEAILEAPGGLYKNLQKIWYSRLLKKLVSLFVRTPFRNDVFRLVNFDFEIPTGRGLIFVTCHTPWKRLLVNWFFENHYALIIDTGNSIKRMARLKNSRKGYNELFHVIRHLRYGGSVVIAADTFDKSDNDPAEMLGKTGNLSLLPVRLARIAGVPLLTAIPQLRNGEIHIYAGPRFEPPIRNTEMGEMMQNMLGFFENEIKKDPSIWAYFVNEPLSQYHKKRIE